MARNTEDLRRKARSDYVFRRFTQATIAAAYGLSEATVGRWKKAAKDDGDDWDKARTAHVIAGEGVEAVVSTVVEDFMIQTQEIMDEIRDGEHTTQEKVAMLVSVSDAMTKMAASAKRFAPKVSELGVAQDVMTKLLDFVRQEFPHHAAAVLEIIEPFGERLSEMYTT
jgi:transposase